MPSTPLAVAPCIRLQPSARLRVVDWPLASTKVMFAMVSPECKKALPGDRQRDGGAAGLSDAELKHQRAAEGGGGHPRQLVGHAPVVGDHLVELVEGDLHRQARDGRAETGVHTAAKAEGDRKSV